MSGVAIIIVIGGDFVPIISYCPSPSSILSNAFGVDTVRDEAHALIPKSYKTEQIFRQHNHKIQEITANARTISLCVECFCHSICLNRQSAQRINIKIYMCILFGMCMRVYSLIAVRFISFATLSYI